jgi:hypothetical protein
MPINKVEQSLELITRTSEQMGFALPDLGDVQPYLKISESRPDYSQAVWKTVWKFKNGNPVSYDRLAVLSFAHVRNTDQAHMPKVEGQEPEYAHFSSASVMYESRQSGSGLSKGFLSFNTSETEDGQSGLSRLIMKDENGRDRAITVDSLYDFREGFDAAMRRLCIARSVEIETNAEREQEAA